MEAKQEILEKANAQDPVLVSVGGGAKDLDVKVISTKVGPMLIAQLHVDCRDVMGANAVNTMAEAVAPLIERITGGRVYLRIISNLATKRLARAWCTVPKEAVGGEEVVDGIVNGSAFAVADPYRAATHNKGIMNGIIAVILATGNDHRAIEAGAHAYAAIKGKYTSLSTWEAEEEVFGASHGEIGGSLLGYWGLPMAVVEAVALHHHPTRFLSDSFSPLTAVHVANAIEHATILCESGPISADHLPAQLHRRQLQGAASTKIGPVSLRDLEMQAIYQSLERHGGSKPKAAEELGISLKTLYNKLNAVGELEKSA